MKTEGYKEGRLVSNKEDYRRSEQLGGRKGRIKEMWKKGEGRQQNEIEILVYVIHITVS